MWRINHENILNKTVESISGKSMFEIVVFVKEDEIMKLNDLKDIIFDEVFVHILPKNKGFSCVQIYVGFLGASSNSVLNMTVKTISAKRGGIIDIYVED